MFDRSSLLMAALAAATLLAPLSDARASALGAKPVRIPSPAGPASGEPFLEVGPDGQVWMSWFERLGRGDDGGHALKVAKLEGRRWSAARTIAQGDSFFVNWADYPTVVALSADHLVAHWPWMSGGDSPYAYDVWVSQSQDGGASWSKPVRPHRDGTSTEHGFVSMVAEGDAVRLVWLDGRKFAKSKGGDDDGQDGHGAGADMTLRSALLGVDGTLSAEVELDGRVCDCCGTDAVQTSNGVLVAYRDRSAEEIRDISLLRHEDGRWGEPYALHEDGWEIPGCPVNGAALDASGSQVVAAWYTGAGDGEHVRAAFSNDGGKTFSAPVAIDEGAPLGRTDAVLLADGSALVVWMESTARSAAIRVRRVDQDGQAHRPWTLARTRSARASGFPRMVRSGDRVVFAWTETGEPSRVRTALAPLR